MNLPDPAMQWAMLCAGWGIVLACVVVDLCWRAGARSVTVLGAVGALAFACTWLPGAASPAHWLGLAFQWPSNLLVLLAGARLLQRLGPAREPVARGVGDPGTGASGEPLLPFYAALLLAAAGIILYLGTFGVGPFVYRSGYTDGAVLAFASLAVIGWRWGGLALPRTSLLFALALGLHLATRLPTGNAWDALIDPFVVVLALVACARAALAAAAARRARAAGATERPAGASARPATRDRVVTAVDAPIDAVSTADSAR
ncbi:MAG: hypothetical protein AB7P21_26405 [Lautropia sp.]